jgi:hypothetical protein
MGYTTDFDGQLEITPALSKEQADYINLLCNTRRMKRDVKVLWEMYKGKHGNPFAEEKTPISIYGHEGEFFARDDGQHGQSGHGTDKSILDYNTPPGEIPYNGMGDFNKVWSENGKKRKKLISQPGLWCSWEIAAEGEHLVWNGGEKFYNYIDWLKYLIDRFFSKWGVLLNGEITWQGEEPDDKGKIIVKKNEVSIQRAVITYEDVEE